jgi:hypothetical protein
MVLAGCKKCVGPKKRRAWAGQAGGQDRFFLIFCFFFIKKKDKKNLTDEKYMVYQKR